MLRDIRDHMPRTKQTDPNNFPEYEYRPYPRMMKDENGKPLRDKAGGYVIVKSAAEEALHLDKVERAEIAKTIAIDGGLVNQVDVEKALEEKHAQSTETTITDAPKRRGRPPKLPADLTA